MSNTTEDDMVIQTSDSFNIDEELVFPIPYRAAANELPAELPTIAAAESASEVISDNPGVTVVGIGPHFVVKFGWGVSFEEGKALIFLQRKTTIPVPKIYAVEEEGDKLYLFMQRIPGRSLEEVWYQLSDERKRGITEKLASHFDQLRDLPSPGGYCNIGQSPLRDSIFFSKGRNRRPGGPFGTVRQFNEALIHRYLQADDAKMEKAKYYCRTLCFVSNNCPPTFSHGNLRIENLMLHPDGVGVTILGWKDAGWYPSYWEYARAMVFCIGWRNDWGNWVDAIITPCLSQFAWLQMLMVDIS